MKIMKPIVEELEKDEVKKWLSECISIVRK